MNVNAFFILGNNHNKINWYCLSENLNAIHILEKNLDKVNWFDLSGNPNAIHILEKNFDKADMRYLSTNPSIFQLDYDAMRENFKGMAEEISKIVWHPSRMSRCPKII